METNILGKRIKELRLEHKLTQPQFGELFEVSRDTVGRWEACEHVPEITTIIKIAKHFNISLDYLFSLSTRKEIQTEKDDISWTRKELLWLDEYKKLLLRMRSIL